MSGLKATLFGRLKIQRGQLTIEGIEARKVQELLSYLLIYRNHPQSRESLSETLWTDRFSPNSRKYLRHTLWRLQSALKTSGASAGLDLCIDNDWIQINTSDNFWLDIAEFEKVFNLVKGKRAGELSTHEFRLLEHAVDLYQGDLLEGWYQGWCIFERERLQTMHLMLLDKLVQFCELHQKYEVGLAYGIEVLRHDHAYERTHRQLMRLYVMIGNRTQALHQYKRCVLALQDELGVEPSDRTKQLYQEIRLDKFKPEFPAKEKVVVKTKYRPSPTLRSILHRVEKLSKSLSSLEQKIQEEIVVMGDDVSDRS